MSSYSTVILLILFRQENCLPWIGPYFSLLLHSLSCLLSDSAVLMNSVYPFQWENLMFLLNFCPTVKHCAWKKTRIYLFSLLCRSNAIESISLFYLLCDHLFVLFFLFFFFFFNYIKKWKCCGRMYSLTTAFSKWVFRHINAIEQ